MKTIIGFLLSLCAIGCFSFQTSDVSYSTRPQLLEQTSLPVLPRTVYANQWNLDTRMLISTDGSVLAVRLENSSGDPAWDSLAIERLKLWKFSPATMSGTPVRVWIKQKISIRVETPLIIALAELVVNDKALADSLYVVLSAGKGKQFDSLVSFFSVASSRAQFGNIGERDVHCYPLTVQPYLERLKVDDFTPPLQIGNQFFIFKRMIAKRQLQ
jgi:TonB family protein